MYVTYCASRLFGPASSSLVSVFVLFCFFPTDMLHNCFISPEFVCVNQVVKLIQGSVISACVPAPPWNALSCVQQLGLILKGQLHPLNSLFQIALKCCVACFGFEQSVFQFGSTGGSSDVLGWWHLRFVDTEPVAYTAFNSLQRLSASADKLPLSFHFFQTTRSV